MTEHTDITTTVPEYQAQACELLLRQVMGEPICNIGDESFMERWAQADDRAAAMRWARDCDIYAGRVKLKPVKRLLISTPQNVQGKFEQMYRDAAKSGTGAMSIRWDPAEPGFVAIVHSELMLADLDATAKVLDEAQANAPSLEEIRRMVAEVEAMAPPKSKFVEVQLNPQMAELVGAPSVEIRRDIHESIVNPLKTDWAARLKPGEELY